MNKNDIPRCSRCGELKPENELNGYDPFAPEGKKYANAYCIRLVECKSPEAERKLDKVLDEITTTNTLNLFNTKPLEKGEKPWAVAIPGAGRGAEELWWFTEEDGNLCLGTEPDTLASFVISTDIKAEPGIQWKLSKDERQAVYDLGDIDTISAETIHELAITALASVHVF